MLIFANKFFLLCSFLMTCFLGVLRNFKKPSISEVIVIDIQNNHYTRYLYLLIKFIIISKRNVLIIPHLNTLNKIRREKNCASILRNKRVSIGFAKSSHLVITDDPKKYISHSPELIRYLTPDYFSVKSDDHTYKIPMAQHPNMYEFQFWDRNVPRLNNQHNSVILFGNFDPLIYNEISSTNIFKSTNRVDILNHLLSHPKALLISSEEQLLNDEFDNRIVIVDSRYVAISQESLRLTLSKFRYFLAVPGATMPLCHNIIESMSVGCVPILEDEYAELISPNLVHEINAIVFSGLKTLNSLIDHALRLPTGTWFEMSASIKNYYDTYCTPETVVDTILDKKHNKVCLMAEHYSVAISKLNKKQEDN